MFAAFGALSLGDTDIVGALLNNFLNKLSNDGHVAMRIGTKNQILRYLHLQTSHGAHHSQDKGSNVTYDGNSLLLIIAEKYESLTGITLNREKLRLVAKWLVDQNDDGLLYEGPYASWEDSLKHRGARLYTNVCYYRAQLSQSRLFRDTELAIKALRTKSGIQGW